MTNDFSPRTRELLRKIREALDAEGRPRIQGAGLYGDVLNLIAQKMPIYLIRTALVMYLGYMSFDYYSKAQQMAAELVGKRAELNQAEAEAAALRRQNDADTAELTRLKAELTRLQSEAVTADAEARAQAQRMDNGSARLNELRAQIETANSEANRIDAEVAAQRQIVAGLPLAVAKKKNEVETAETDIEQSVWSEHLYIEGLKQGDWRTYLLGGLLGRSADRDGIHRYPMTQIFKELHAEAK